MRNDNTDHKEQLDDFSCFVRQKLADHRMPVEVDYLKDIESRMPVAHRRNLLPWLSVSAAAAVALLLLLVLPYPDEVKQGELAERLSEKEQPVMSENYKQENIGQKFSVTVIPSSHSAGSISGKKLHAEVILPAESDSVPSVTEVESGIQTIPEEQPAEEKETSRPASGKRSDSSVQPEDNRSRKKNFNLEATTRSKRSKDGKWLLAASFGSGGHISLFPGGGNDLSYDMNEPGGIQPPDPPFTNDGMVPPEAYSNANYSLPLSFGMTVRKELSKRVGLETGLVYTYLSTKFSGYSKQNKDARLSLHYLGIPVNAVVNLWDNPKWNIYLSGGVMMEKGLRAIYVQNSHQKAGIFTSTEKKGIGGLQWSLNASLGISYRIYRDWSLYVEPRLSYYFENYQPASIRTDEPVIVGLGAGIRYAF